MFKDMKRADTWQSLGSLAQRIACRLTARREDRMKEAVAPECSNSATASLPGREKTTGGLKEEGLARPNHQREACWHVREIYACQRGNSEDGEHLDVPPSFAAFDVADCGSRDAIVSGNATSGSCIGTNGENVTVCQFSDRVRLSLAVCSAPLGVHVSDVVGNRAKEQMVRIDAKPNVALVTDKEAWRDGPPVELPRRSMSKDPLLFGYVRSIAPLRLATHPQKAAAIRLRDRPQREVSGK
jgi:hypothetical protein